MSLATIAIGVSLLLAASSARGELLFSDSFDYPTGDLDGQGPPAGSPPGQGGWVKITRNPEVAGLGLDFPGIFIAGKSAQLQGASDLNSEDAFATIGPVTSDIGSVWIGFLMRKTRPGGPADGFAVVAAIGESITTPSVGIGMIFTKNRYGLDNDTGDFGSRSVSSIRVGRQTVWLVAKLDFAAGHEYLWVNPSPDSEPDIASADADLTMTDEFKAAGFSYLRMRVGYAQCVFQFDELRAGTTFEDVVGP